MPVGDEIGHGVPTTLVAMTRSVVAPDALSLLALIPELIGFEPTSSIVLVTFRSGSSGAAVRVDLPPDDDGGGRRGSGASDELRRFATTLIGIVCKVHGVDGLLAVTYGEGPRPGGAPATEVVAELRRAASDAGFTLLDALYVSSDGWGDYEGRRHGDRAELDAALSLRRADPDATELRPSPHEEAALPVAAATAKRRTAQALAVLRDRDDRPDPVWFAEYSASWSAGETGPVAAALTAHVLSQPFARDAALFTWGWGSPVGRRALRFEERHLQGKPHDDDQIALALAGKGGLTRPSERGVQRAIRLLREVAAKVTGADGAPVLSSLAWLNWALGRGSVAAEYVDQARTADPDYPFAELIETMLDAGMLPEWVFLEPRADDDVDGSGDAARHATSEAR
ncbi:hypothetical protein GCM10027568_03100 [Humibacter soli]